MRPTPDNPPVGAAMQTGKIVDVRSLSLAGGVALALATAAQAQQGGATAPPAASVTAELEEIVVVGTRAALVASRDLKRDATVVQDSIVAEDIGRFPDDNVADSLSHITGITIQRTRGGEAQYVNVRGLGPEYRIVTS